MKKRFLSLIICGIFWSTLNAQTKSDDSGVWIISGGGSKPSRFLLLADENSMKSIKVGSRTATEIAIRLVLENPNSYSGLLSGNVQVYCDKGTIAGSNLMMTNKGKVSKMPDVSEQKPEDEGDRQIIKFVCNKGKDERNRTFPPTNETMKSAGKTGFLFIGIKEASPGVEKAEDFVRNVLWSNKASELLKKDLKTQKEILDLMQAQVDQLKSVNKNVTDQKAVMDDAARRAKARTNGAYVPKVQRLMGKNESNVVAALGKPDSYKDDGKGNRWLYYYRYEDTRQMMIQQNRQWSGQFPVGEFLECYVTILIYNGVVIDYTANENGLNAGKDLGF